MKLTISISSKQCIRYYLLAFSLSPYLLIQAQETVQITSIFSVNSFPIINNNKAAIIYIDSSDAPVVTVAAKAFQQDVELISNVKPLLNFTQKNVTSLPIIIGTRNHSKLVDQLVENGKLSTVTIDGKWESFIITVIKNPLPNVPQALVIVGSDARGTAFGVFEVSKQMGVSPWYWWADVIPEKKSAIFIHGTQLNGPPSVQYRGIFLNDEDWGLQPWAAKKMDADIKDIGPNTYAHIFELLLRLKANYIWPAMHPCTKAFYYYKDNAKLADKYAIVVGTSHCEPMLRNNVFEWAENYKKEYGTDPKEWRYDLNKEQIAPYWQDRITEVKNYESVVTVGMRGIHDGSMPGPKDINAKVKLLETVIEDQRKILQNTYQKPINTIPQIFCPYKEVLQLYRKGMKLPDDVTIAWADDNYGYITQLSDTKERQRSGGSGVYYHLSYWGAPQDYLWLSTHSPSLISYEMTKAFDFNAKRLWVFNVGDLKPAEMELNFALDLAYNINKWQPTNAINYSEFWAEEIFGKAFAKPIAAIKTVFYQLAQEGKPEHLGMINYSNEIADKRIADYKGITEQSEALFTKMPDRLKDAFYELVLYPVKGAYLMNQKVFFAKRSIELAKQGNSDALTYSRLSEAAYKSIQNITNTYNKNIANGKWDGIMSSHPRDLEVFKMPKVATKEMVDSNKNNLSNTIANIKQPTIILATDFRNKKNILGKNITIINGLGISGKGITVLPFTALSSDTLHLEKVPYVDYQITLSKGNHSISIKALPTHSINQEYKVRYAISVNGDRPQIINLEAEASSKIWSKNVVNGFSSATTLHTILLDTISTIRLYILEPGVVINQLEIL